MSQKINVRDDLWYKTFKSIDILILTIFSSCNPKGNTIVTCHEYDTIQGWEKEVQETET